MADESFVPLNDVRERSYIAKEVKLQSRGRETSASFRIQVSEVERWNALDCDDTFFYSHSHFQLLVRGSSKVRAPKRFLFGTMSA
jgi:hypothetical protein